MRRHFNPFRFASRPKPTARYVGYGAAFAAVSVSAVSVGKERNEQTTTLDTASTLSLIRSYLVWTSLSFPAVVDAGPGLLDAFLNSPVPGVPTVTEIIVKLTVFPQFIAGETSTACIPEMERLRRQNVGSAFNYSAEADVDDWTNEGRYDPETLAYHEIEAAIDVQGSFERRMYREGWDRGSSCMAIKVTGLIDPAILSRAATTLHRLRAEQPSRHGSNVPYPGFPANVDQKILNPDSSDVAPFAAVPRGVPQMTVRETDPGLQPGDLDALKLLWERLDSIVSIARRNGVRINIDGEETYYQPVLDGYTRLLARKYNRPCDPDTGIPWHGPVVYATNQAYLRRQPEMLKAFLADAAAENYAYGVKLVRGGYIVKEGVHWQDHQFEIPNPIWPNKPATDDSYNASVDTICEAIETQLAGPKPDLAPCVIFGTHNAESISVIFASLQKHNLVDRLPSGKMRLKDDVKGRINIAQLYGMKEDLADKVSAAFDLGKSPISVKFMAYGTLRQTLPFLGRRAVENKSVMGGEGGAAFERRRIGQELRKRFTFGIWA